MTDKDLSHLSDEDQAYIKSLREEAKTNRIKASDLQTAIAERDSAVAEATTKLTDFETKLKAANDVVGKYDTLRDEHAQALVRSETNELQLAKLNAALDAGIPHTFAGRLQGDTVEAIKADALSLKESIGGQTGRGRVAFDRTNVSSETGSQNAPEFPSIAAHFAAAFGEE